MNNETGDRLAIPIKLGENSLAVGIGLQGTYLIDIEQVTNLIDMQQDLLFAYLQGKNIAVTEYIPILIAAKYWLHEAVKGNIKAQALAIASINECVMRRVDQFLYES